MFFQSHISNGAIQGDCLCPTLFNIYINKIIKILRNLILIDNTTLAPFGMLNNFVFFSVVEIKEMLKICED